jgi:hypothetical protein
MTAPRVLAAGAIAVALSGALVAMPSDAVAKGGTGTIAVHLKGPDGSPQKNIKLCPTKKTGPSTVKKVGKCDKTNKKGNAKLKHVLTGKRYVSIYSGNQLAGTFPNKIKVKAGKTTHKTFTLAG